MCILSCQGWKLTVMRKLMKYLAVNQTGVHWSMDDFHNTKTDSECWQPDSLHQNSWQCHKPNTAQCVGYNVINTQGILYIGVSKQQSCIRVHCCDSYLAPESEVLYFGFEVSNIGDLRPIFTVRKQKEKGTFKNAFLSQSILNANEYYSVRLLIKLPLPSVHIVTSPVH